MKIRLYYSVYIPPYFEFQEVVKTSSLRLIPKASQFLLKEEARNKIVFVAKVSSREHVSCKLRGKVVVN